MPVVLMVDGPSLGGFVCPVTATTTELWKMGQVRAQGSLVAVPVASTQEEEACHLAGMHCIASCLHYSRSIYACVQVRPGDTVRFRRMTVEEVGGFVCLALPNTRQLRHRRAALPCQPNPACLFRPIRWLLVITLCSHHLDCRPTRSGSRWTARSAWSTRWRGGAAPPPRLKLRWQISRCGSPKPAYHACRVVH